MLDFLFEFLARAAVMVPAILIAAALLWYAFKRFGVVATGAPFNAGDMRTWPLGFALADALLFALTFALVMALMGDGEWTAALGAGIAALVGVGIAPLLLARLVR
jgi:hypothetical protein